MDSSGEEEVDPTKLCFVVGPIGDPGSDTRRHADWLLKGIIKPVFKQHFPEYYVERADEIVSPGSINSQVITRLMDAPLVVADMSQHNANAFYELAIRHMMRLPTIHLIHKDWKIPFDVAPYRAITFSRDDYDDLEEAKSALRSAVEEVIRPGFQVENPVTHARGRTQIDQHATPEMKVIVDELENLRARIDAIEGGKALLAPEELSLGAFESWMNAATTPSPRVFIIETEELSPDRFAVLANRVSLAFPKSKITVEAPNRLKVDFKGRQRDLALGAKRVADLSGIRAIHGLGL
jgi:hypothetical protein